MDYFSDIKKRTIEAYEFANRAKKSGFDPEPFVEISLANDLADRVESLLGIKGVAQRIRELSSNSREEIAFKITEEISSGKLLNLEINTRIDLAVRVGTAILTEGVLVAPTEGISKVVLENNYIAIYYAGPIRSAGGTAAALTAYLADIARKANNIPPYKATDREVERIIEEINIYENEVAHLQYRPPDEDIEKIVRGLPIQINGEPTADITVQNTKGVAYTDRIRGGVPLVICEGIAQKYKKLKKYAKDWKFLDELKGVKEEKQDLDIAYLQGTVAGRPILAYPSAKGGFRIRYGRSFTNGLMAKNIHPVTMKLLDEFIANGTHIKIEKPGKGAVVTSNDKIHPPICRLKNGDVVIADENTTNVEKILFLGDILLTYGDFLKSNAPLEPSPYVEEWWKLEAGDYEVKTIEDAIKISKEKNVPLHPDYILFWRNIEGRLDELIAYLEKAKIGEYIEMDLEAKELLEELFLPHKVRDQKIIIEKPYRDILLLNLGYDGTFEKVKNTTGNILERLSKASGFIIRDKVGTYIGARMGRPEKAKIREMEGKPSMLFPTGDTSRDLLKYEEIQVEISNFKCNDCQHEGFYRVCTNCGSRNVTFLGIRETKLNIREMINKYRAKYGNFNKLKGVKGLFSKTKVPEYIEKGIIRNIYDLPINKDGTMRFDAINITMTHFKPKDINTSVEKLRELGYKEDYLGNPLKSDDQICELKLQDIIVPKAGLEFLFKAGKVIDQFLKNIYGYEEFYKFQSLEDVIGTLVITQSPHTSAGIVSRVIGYTNINGIFANPFLHAAKRRNVDGDEDSIFLLMDGFLNFSKHFLESKRGGTMDAPIVIIINIDPKEVDDEVYNMEIENYSLDFYNATLLKKMPSEVKIKTVNSILDNLPEKIFNLTHPQSSINKGPYRSKYSILDDMTDKIDKEIKVMEKIKAVNIKEAITRIINDHFLPDIYGNLRRFTKQEFRCSKCNRKYRRPMLYGKCECGGDLILTITRGAIEKYLDITKDLIKKYQLDNYYSIRINLIELEIGSLFSNRKQNKLR